MTNNERLAETMRRRQIKLLRHQVSVRNAIDTYLDTLGKAMVGLVVSLSPNEVSRQAYKQQRLEKLIEAVSAKVSETYRDIRGYHIDEMAALADTEALFYITQVNELLGKDIAKLVLTAREAVSLVKETLIAGAPLPDWWEGQNRAVKEKFAQAMRIGILGGETDAALIARVRGTKELGFKDGIVDVSKRMAKILVRGAGSATVAAIRRKATLDNPDVFHGIQQASVLDGRTSATCISYAGKVWSLPDYKPVGHALPFNGGVPRHPNCRSTEIAVLTERYGGAPADDISFEEFLKDKSPELLDDLLGPGRAALYRDGKITLADLVDQQGRPLTLEELVR